jgi:hypothetical protein
MGKPILTTSPVPRQRIPDPELGGDGCLAPLTSVSANEVAHARLVGQRDDERERSNLKRPNSVSPRRRRRAGRSYGCWDPDGRGGLINEYQAAA